MIWLDQSGKGNHAIAPGELFTFGVVYDPGEPRPRFYLNGVLLPDADADEESD